MAILGKTGIEVSPLCFGSLTFSKFQANLSLKKGTELLVYAREKGINFIDTAEIYDNYAYIREAIKEVGREQWVITSKAYCYDEETAERSVKKALEELDTDYIDIFMLHEQESLLTLKGHREALKRLKKFKDDGIIRAIGISTHFIGCVNATALFPEIEVIHPIINKKGIGIQDGTPLEMLHAIEARHKKGIGIYSMKALGGGHLIQDNREALEWIRTQPAIDATAIGMQSKQEIDYNADLFLKGEENEAALKEISNKKRRLIIGDYCIGCGSCERRCKQDGIHVVDGRAVPNEKCILCGYCATVCPEFCIKVI
ncbi:MAG: aldo/keto reductase [Peptoniphilus sp.]|nr:aldo/keto reductase [Peptoniphilus sp.]MDD7363829.1 aldo/keto reductase [Bacillota bacterium]MDY6044332.1 aldo/keto reductase [Peptoniphilus sp.]